MLAYDSVDALIADGAQALIGQQSFLTMLLDHFLDHGRIANLDAEWTRRDGRPITVRLNGRFAVSEAGESAFELVVQDVTVQKERTDQVRQAQKMATVGRLTAGMVHDLNNLLTVIYGNAEILGTKLDVHDSRQHEVGQIRDAVEQGARLSRQLLGFSRQETPPDQAVSLGAVVADTQGMLVSLLGAGIEFEVSLSEPPLFLKIARGGLEQIIMNLVLNARDAIGDKGRITIETRPAGRNPPSSKRGWVLEGALLSVTDTGIGIDEGTRARLFEPFFTTKPAGAGTGLGLSIVADIVGEAGGSIEVRSALGGGTTFEIWLPLAQDSVAKSTSRYRSRTRAGGKETILLVEDDDSVRRLTRRSLTSLGYDVITATNGKRAIEFAARCHSRIDLVVSDLRMPEMGGVQMAELLMATRPETPVLYVSGYIVEDLGDLQSMDPLSVLPKPFDPVDLGARVRLLLDRRPGGQRVQREA